MHIRLIMLGHGTYLTLELAWALPVIVIQWLAGPGSLWDHRRLLCLTVGITSLYLSLADTFAITDGIWSINPARTVAFSFGPLPLEEVLFFLLTNTMVVQAIVLLRCSAEPRARIKRLFERGS